jgi:hypothetical protein
MTRILIIHPDTPPPGMTWPIDSRFSVVNTDTREVWATAQKIVEGYVEIAHLTEYEPTPENKGAAFAQGWHLSAYVNEDGIGMGMIPCIQVQDGPLLFGPVVIVRERVDGEGETHYADLTDADIETIRRRVQLIEVISAEGVG